MDRFYENLNGGHRGPRGPGLAPMGKARALQEAKRWLRGVTDADGTHPYEHPVYWSPFVLIGDPD
jgi:CHAT domain-containing protein